MKYGIITFHNTLNCGAALQAYALCKFLRNNGVECDILDYKCPSIVRRELQFKKSANPIKTGINYLFVWPKQKKMNSDFLSIMHDEKMLSEVTFTPENIDRANSLYDGFITGSDQVMNLKITQNDYNYFLAFANDDKAKIAFSASLGERWNDSENKKVISFLERYSAISLREKNDCDFLNALGLKSVHTCDPTMLLTTKDWKQISIIPKERDYVLLYNPESGVEKIATLYAKQTGKQLIWIGTGRVKLSKKGAKTVRPSEWLGYIQNANAVFTDSYHGLLFSLYFNKPVWTMYNGERSSRQLSLYNKLGIYDCVYSTDKGFQNNINYAACNTRIEHFREESAKYLISSIYRR